MSGKPLIIVESPKKAKTISAFMNGSYLVKATVGHFRDLPKKELGVDLDTFEARYVCEGRGAETQQTLQQEIANASHVYLATDLDREGEAIAWHLVEEFGLQAGQWDRIVYTEVTEKAVRAALAHPVPLNIEKVEAQQARRILDRIIGYPISSILRQQSGQNLSAGRVQSVALLLIVQREKEIRGHVPIPHFLVKHTLQDSDVVFEAKWDTSDYVSDEAPYITDQVLAKQAAQLSQLRVAQSEKKPQKRNPPAPFITISMQQAASNALNASVEDTMKAAQQLFDAGAITYHRTDNPNLSDEAVEQIRALIAENLGQDALPEKAPMFKSSADAQEAHEGIRPTNITAKAPGIDGDGTLAHKLYSLIRARVIASQMRPAEYDATTLVLKSTDGSEPGFTFVVKGRVVTYKGWLSAMQDDFANEEEAEKDSQLPLLKVGQVITSQGGRVEATKTKAPKRYSETALLNKLEREGVGRPATYASIISVLKARGFVEYVNKGFYAQPSGFLVADGLADKFEFMNLAYTREIERGLDCVAQGTTPAKAVLEAANKDLQRGLAKLKESPICKPVECQCGKPMRRVVSKNDSFEPFWGCTDLECKHTLFDLRGKAMKEPGDPDTPCPLCKAPMQRRRFNNKDDDKAKPKPVWTCTKWKGGCKGKLTDRAGKAVKGYPCPVCKKNMLRKRKGEKGPFWGCAGFPNCKTTFPDKNGRPVKPKKA